MTTRRIDDSRHATWRNKGSMPVWRISLSLGLLLPGLGCASPGASPAAPSTASAPSPTPAPTASLSAPVRLYTLQRGNGPSALSAYEVEPQTGRLIALGGLELPDTYGLAAGPDGAWLHARRCRGNRGCWVAALRLDGAGVPSLVAESRPLTAILDRLSASDSFVFARWDDSSTGYAAGLVAYRLDPSTGTLGTPSHFAVRGGCYNCVRRLYGYAVGHDGTRVYTVERGGRLATYPMDADGPGAKMGESGGHPDRPLAIVAHPRGGFVYVLSQTEDAAYISSYALDADGLPAFHGAVPVGLREPYSIALDPEGRWLWVNGRSAIDTFALDAQGLPDFSTTQRVDSAHGRMVVEPRGRFLYLARAERGVLATLRIDAASGALSEPAATGVDATDVVVLNPPRAR